MKARQVCILQLQPGQVFGVPEKYRRKEEICNTGQVDLSQNISSPLASQKSDTDRNIGKLLNREFIHSFIFLSFVSYVFSRVSFIIFSTRCTHGLKGGREGGRRRKLPYLRSWRLHSFYLHRQRGGGESRKTDNREGERCEEYVSEHLAVRHMIDSVARWQILQRSVAEPLSFKLEGSNAYSLKIWL